jgi:hypothetical protein
MASKVVVGRNRSEAWPMGLFHCPLCIGLAVLSALRFSAHAVMAFQLRRQRFEPAAHGDRPMGTLIHP